MEDIRQLMQSEEASRRNHIWKVDFEVEVPDEDAPDWIFESLNIVAGGDAQDAIDSAREHALNDPAFGVQVLAFRLRGVKLLAEAEF